MNKFRLKTKMSPKGDQPEAIDKIVSGFGSGIADQLLLGVTGSGKTFTMAKVVESLQKPTLIITHNKTLAAQLYSEFKEFFPDNAVHYFVSYYDYYQPEAYVPRTDTYIEKDADINDEIDRLRNATTASILSRSDTLIVASVSCIYGLGSPDLYREYIIKLSVGQKLVRDELIRNLIDIQYERNDKSLERGKFRVRGDVLEIIPSYEELSCRIEFFGDEIEAIKSINPLTGEVLGSFDFYSIFPAKHFVTEKDRILKVKPEILAELDMQLNKFKKFGKLLEAQRLEERVRHDLEMIEETGYISGIENYSRYLTGKNPGEAPATLIDYFPEDFLCFIDESHMTVPQVRGMYNGDRARKETLVDFGFRLPSALDNRPLRFSEFQERINKVLYVSATPAEYELGRVSNGKIKTPAEFYKSRREG
ncbi:DEAD/DEAH box helicase family protein, partial [Patescibacteria group bacterium]|nr:DEAD/DEAH box helicase family protein [Patescibacteria group bacterium]